MAATITALPTPPSRQSPSTFSERTDTFLAALPAFQAEANTLAAEAEADAATAAAAASTATTKANEASASAQTATEQAAIAVGAVASLPDGTISDAAYDPSTWDGDTTSAPSKNAIRDKFESLSSSAETLTNKRINPRVLSTTSAANPSINTDNCDIYKLTAQAEAVASFTTNLSGTPVDGQVLIIQITGTAARAITWGAKFEASTVALPTTTVTTNMLTVGFIYNSVTAKWRCVASC